MKQIIVNGFIIQKEGLKVSIQPGTMVLDSGTRNRESSWTELSEPSAEWRYVYLQKYAAKEKSAIGTNVHIDKLRAKLEADQHFLQTWGNRGHVCNDGTYKIF